MSALGEPPPAALTETTLEFDALYREHRAQALRLAYLVCGDHARAEDAVAEAFAKVYPKWRRGKVREFGPYLRRAVVNEVRKGIRRRSVEQREEARHRVGPDTADVGEALGDRELVRAALDRLPTAQRAAVVLRYFEDLSLAETADVLGVSVGTVKAQVSRGLDRLRGAFDDTEAAP